MLKFRYGNFVLKYGKFSQMDIYAKICNDYQFTEYKLGVVPNCFLKHLLKYFGFVSCDSLLFILRMLKFLRLL